MEQLHETLPKLLKTCKPFPVNCKHHIVSTYSGDDKFRECLILAESLGITEYDLETLERVLLSNNEHMERDFAFIVSRYARKEKGRGRGRKEALEYRTMQAAWTLIYTQTWARIRMRLRTLINN